MAARLGVAGLAGAFAAVPFAAPLAAQTVNGRVLDEARGSPVAGAVVRLLDAKDDEKARALADSLGRFVLTPPSDGRYVLEAVRLGYEPTRSPLLDMHAGDDPVPVDLMMTPLPIGLKGLEVTAEDRAVEVLKPFGIRPADLGLRWVDRAFIDSVQVKRDFGTIIQRKAIPGVYVRHPENRHDQVLCISQQRGRKMGADTCGLVVLDGVPLSPAGALDVDPDAIEAIAILRPFEAATFWGTLGGSGAVLIWTRKGRQE